MKHMLLLAVVGSVFASCAQEEPITDQAAQSFQRGIRGEGTLYQQTNDNDPFIRDEGTRGR